MNDGLRYMDLAERLLDLEGERLERWEFMKFFPEVASYQRSDAFGARFLEGWFWVGEASIYQLTSYAADGRMILLVENILFF